MQERLHNLQEQPWIIWNGTLGISDFVMIGQVEKKSDKWYAWLDDPYDMVGPLCIDTLETNGEIDFAACTIMSSKRWQETQVKLRQDAYESRRKAEQQLFDELSEFNRRKRAQRYQAENYSEKAYRELLKLPVKGVLILSQIKSAYRQVAKKAHPDAGGSQEQFIRIKEAYDALLKSTS